MSKLPSLLAAFALAACASSAIAQAYPSRPIKLVVPFPAGGGVDLLARVVGQKVGEALKQPFVIDNKPGACSRAW